MKAIISLVFLSLCSGSVFAVTPQQEFIVKEAVISYFTHLDDGFRQPQVHADDIWSLEEVSNDPAMCLTTVAGLVKVSNRRGPSIYRFWVCLNKEGQSGLYGEVLDSEQIADE